MWERPNIVDGVQPGHNDLLNTIWHIQQSTPIALIAWDLQETNIYSLD